MSNRRIMGIDPGLTRCGISVIEVLPDRSMKLVDVSVILTPVDAPLEERLMLLEQNLIEWMTTHKPNAVAVERVFSQHNVRTVMGTGQAAGIALLVAAKQGVPVVMHTPSEVKAAVTGSGRADKTQVAQMVKKILSLDVIPKPVDATDSIALAICHAWRGSGDSKIRAALASEKKRIARLKSS